MMRVLHHLNRVIINNTELLSNRPHLHELQVHDNATKLKNDNTVKKGQQTCTKRCTTGNVK